MDYKELISSSVQSLRNNILRTSLTMLGIIIGISSVILIVSLGQGAVAFITNELSTFGTNNFSINPGSGFTSVIGGANTLTLDDANAIRSDKSLTNIQSVAPLAMTNVVVSANDIDSRVLLYGVTSDITEILKPKMIAGEFISRENDLDVERVAVIGPKVAEKFFGQEAEPIGEKIKIDNKTFKIIGIAKSASILAGSFFDNAIFSPLDVVLNQIEGEVEISEIDVSVQNQAYINQTIENVQELLRERHGIEPGEEDDFTIQNSSDAISTVQTITNLLTLLIAAISGISLVVGGVGVMNIMLVSVTERTREIGLLKSIGALEKDILRQFLIESVVMTLIGGVIGIILGVAGAFLVSMIVKIPFVVSLPAVIIAVAVSMLVGIVFGLYPARRAARLSPIDALRYE